MPEKPEQRNLPPQFFGKAPTHKYNKDNEQPQQPDHNVQPVCADKRKEAREESALRPIMTFACKHRKFIQLDREEGYTKEECCHEASNHLLYIASVQTDQRDTACITTRQQDQRLGKR